jgi:hypothetical protein
LLRQWGRNDHQIQSKGIASLKLCADLPLETERNVALPVWLLLDAVETDFGFDIEIYKK